MRIQFKVCEVFEVSFVDFTNSIDSNDGNDFDEFRRFANGRFLQRLVGLEAGNGRGKGLLHAYEGVPKGRAVWIDQPDPQSFVLDPGLLRREAHAVQGRIS